jgi:hypothetical protein
MREVLQGIGQLENWEQPDRQREVSYRFLIITDIIETPEYPRVASKMHTQGIVKATTGEVLPEGSS